LFFGRGKAHFGREEELVLGNSGDEHSQLGKLLAGLASERGASTAGHGRIEEAIARRIQEAFSGGQDFSREEISDYLHGERWPEREFIQAFAEAFSLTVKERRLLAWAYTFSEAPDPRIVERPPPVVD
jgi:transcriptional regulator with XRE-family HTH domain